MNVFEQAWNVAHGVTQTSIFDREEKLLRALQQAEDMENSPHKARDMKKARWLVTHRLLDYFAPGRSSETRTLQFAQEPWQFAVVAQRMLHFCDPRHWAYVFVELRMGFTTRFWNRAKGPCSTAHGAEFFNNILRFKDRPADWMKLHPPQTGGLNAPVPQYLEENFSRLLDSRPLHKR